MGFTNPITGAGGQLVRNLIKSVNYVAGLSGWRITKLGDAEFNNVTMRGTLDVIDSTGREVKITPGPFNDSAQIDLWPAPGSGTFDPAIVQAERGGANLASPILALTSGRPTGTLVAQAEIDLRGNDNINQPSQMLLTAEAAGGVQVGYGGSYVLAGIGSNGNVNAVTTAGTTTSATYVDFPGSPAAGINKHWNSSKIKVSLAVSCFSTVANTTPEFGININGVDYDLGGYQIGPASTILPQTLIVPVAAGLVAGIYSCTLRWKRTAGTGTLTTNTGCWLSLMVEEIPA